MEPMLQQDSGCRARAWMAGALAGLVVLGFQLGALGLFAALFLGLVTAGLSGALLIWAFCAPRPVSAAPVVQPRPELAPVPAPQPVPVAAPVAVPAPQPVSAPVAVAVPVPEPVAQAAAVAALEPAAPVAGPVVDSAPAKPVSRPAPRAGGKDAGAGATGTKAPKAKATKAGAPKAKAIETGAAEVRKPRAMKAPRKAGADDLKQIEGIGPALEKVCNDLGIWHFDQIAKWGEAEVAWMDGNLKGFRGRVTRDRWVAQAKIIVEEGLAAFLERAKTNDY